MSNIKEKEKEKEKFTQPADGIVVVSNPTKPPKKGGKK